jgi:glycosyltransferase involved in cell wall biosynthesis
MDKTIAFVSSIDSNVLGGGEHWNINIARALKQRGYRTILIARSHSLIAEKFADFADMIYPFDFKFDFHPVKIFQMTKILKNESVNYLVCNFNKDLSIAAVAGRLCNIDKIIFRNGYPIIKKKWQHKIRKNLYDVILTNSNRIKEKYISYNWGLEEKITVQYNGFKFKDNSKPQDFIRKDSYTIIGVGRLTDVKGFDLFLKALLILKEKNYNIKGIIIGDGPKYNDLKTYALKHDLNVEMHGFSDNVFSFLKKADILLHCSREEGMPNVLIEAMSIGLPVVASDAGATDELIDNNSNGIMVEQEGDFASAIIETIENIEKTNKRRKNAELKIKNDFNFEGSVENMIQLLIK